MIQMKPIRTGLAALLLAAVLPTAVLAHGGEDHGAPAAAAPAPAVAQQSGYGAEGSAFQAVLVPANGKIILYLADADTNAPVVGAAIDAEAGGWQGQAQATRANGVYELAWTPGAVGTDIALVVSAGGRDDLLLVQGVMLPPPPPPAAAEPPVAHWTHWTGGGVIGAVLLGMLVIALRRRRNQSVSVLAFLLLAGPAFAHGGEDHGDAPPAPAQAQPGQTVTMPKATQFLLGIQTSKVEPRQAANTVRVVGRVIPDPVGYARVQPSQPARIVADPAHPIPVPGQTVRRGQVLAVLEPTLSTLEKGDKRASLSRVDGEIAIAERDLARQEALGGIVPAKQIETTRIRLDQLRRERGQITGTALGRELLTAPIDGVVADVHVVPGEVVASNQVLVEIVDLSRLRIEATIHDLAVAKRISSATAASKLVPEQSFPLVLLGISPKVDPLDQGVHAIFQVAREQAAALNIGMPMDVFLATGATRLRTAVPRDAIAEVGGRQVVFVRTAPEQFEIRPVKIEQVVGPLAEIAAGVRAGDRVVVQGIEQIKAGK